MRSVLSQPASALLSPGPPAPHTFTHDAVPHDAHQPSPPRRSYQWDTAFHFGLPQAPSGVGISPDASRESSLQMLSPSYGAWLRQL
jgi:hypothetical protein